jgi:ectoine hydroxylase-related dioxygenase (phytanoyl-CoA dioxygenase family)
MIRLDVRTDALWLERALEALEIEGCVIVEGVLDDALCQATKEAMYRAQDAIHSVVGKERLDRAGELGVLRLMLAYDPHFFRLLELPEVIAIVDATVSETAILHLQNGLVLPPITGDAPEIFQLRFHQDFPRYLNGFMMSVNTFLAIDPFTADNGATTLVPATHQRLRRPDDAFLADAGISALCPAGSMIVFDSTLWHAAGENRSSADRLAINQQFTRSYVKQQVDYVRALGEEVVLAQKPKTQQLLGWYTRVVTSLDEYYRPAEERLYRAGQG